MKLHRRAKTCPNSRLLLCRRIEEAGLEDRSSAPCTQPGRLPTIASR